MASLVIALAYTPEQRAILEPLAKRAVGGDWWTLEDRHKVEVRLEFLHETSAALPNGFIADLGCQDTDSPITWTNQPHTLLSATGDWDESSGLRALEQLSGWVRGVIPNPEFFQAGLVTSDVELTLQPEGGIWLETSRY